MESQKANIQYSVDFSKVPLEVSKILCDVEANELKNLIDLLRAAKIAPENVTLAAVSIKQARQVLIQLDQRLAECNSILGGYLQIVSQNILNLPASDGKESE